MNTTENISGTKLLKPLRLLPGIILGVLLCLARFVLPVVLPNAVIYGVFGAFILSVAILIWWVFFSRAPGTERWTAIFVMVSALVVTSQFIDKSISTSMMGLMFPLYSIPVLALCLVAWAIITRNLSNRLRQLTKVVTLLLASGFWVCLRSNGMDGETRHYFAYRWSKTSEEKLIAANDNRLAPLPADMAVSNGDAEWPGFRGQNRDGIIHGVRINSDWTKSPPVELWRRPVGPGCSSFAVHGFMLYTQEQLGNSEMVTCYNLNTGEPVWKHSDSTRFWDSHAGAGPRSTPTLCNGRVYTLGATGILNVLDAHDGTVIWSHNAAKDTEVKIPGWGYTCSPLVIDSTVLVAIAGEILAYDINSGHKRWSGTNGGESYSSPHLITEGGVSHVLFLNQEGVSVYSPADGKKLWTLKMKGGQIVQPAIIDEKDLLINAGDQKGMKRITLKDGSGGLIPQETWSSDKIKPYFNDFVVHKGHAYGFDGLALVCIDIENGTRSWRGGRFGGQILLLADQDLLLILSEKGDLALVSATPDKYTEFGHRPAIKGKTWNHPVLVNDILVVRNGEEMAAFRMSKMN